MNFGPLNGWAVNGSQVDNIVRNIITGECFAVAYPNATYIPEGAFRFRVYGEASADGVLTPQVLSRAPGYFEALAAAVVSAQFLYRGASEFTAEAQATLTPHYYPRTYYNNPANNYAQVLQSLVLGKINTVPAVFMSSAEPTCRFSEVYTPSVVGQCEAVGSVLPESVIRYKFVKRSDAEYIVPYINNQFLVR